MPKRIGNLEAQLLNAAARRADLVYASVTHEDLSLKAVPHSMFVAYYQDTWMDCGDSTWPTVGMTVVQHPTERMLAISEDGDVFTYVANTTTEEHITPTPAALRGVTTIAGLAFAFGMRRQAFLRTGEGVWSAMPGPELAEGEVGGFESACGDDTKEIYAVGWRGQIWQFDGRQWLAKNSPTNLILTSCALHHDDLVYACGQQGTVIRGRHDSWDVLPQPGFSDDFLGIHSFGGKLYLATLTALYELAGDHIAAVDAANSIAKTFHSLTSAGGVLWSIGSEDAISFDGHTWSTTK